MNKKIIFSVSLVSLIALLCCGFMFRPIEQEAPKATINWISIEEAVELAPVDGKKIFVDVYTDWCGWCKRMDATTFKNPEVVKYMNENFHAVKFDAEQKEEVVIKGSTYKFVENGRRGYHELAAELMGGKMSYPTYVFLMSNLEIQQVLPGYRGADDLMPILHYLNDELYNKDVGFDQFVKDFKAKQNK